MLYKRNSETSECKSQVNDKLCDYGGMENV